ncbi:hypothetical protein K0M31_005624, partial [Melipona bicolor]
KLANHNLARVACLLNVPKILALPSRSTHPEAHTLHGSDRTGSYRSLSQQRGTRKCIDHRERGSNETVNYAHDISTDPHAATFLDTDLTDSRVGRIVSVNFAATWPRNDVASSWIYDRRNCEGQGAESTPSFGSTSANFLTNHATLLAGNVVHCTRFSVIVARSLPLRSKANGLGAKFDKDIYRTADS